MSAARLLIGFAQRIRRPGAAISIKHMLTLSFGLLIATLAGLGGLSLVRMQQIDASAQSISEAHLQGVADSLRLAELATRRHSLDYLMAMSEKDKVAEVAAQIDAIDKQIKQLSTDYEAKLSDEEKLKVFKDAEQALRHYSTLRQGVQAFVMVGGSAAAIDLITSEGARRFDDARTLLLQLSALNVQAAKEEASLSNETYLKTRRQMLILIATLVLGASLLGFLVIRSITHPLQAVVDLATHVAQGDLRPNMQAVQSSGTEIGRMNTALAAMTERLREMVESVRSGVDTVRETSVRISTGNQDLSKRTEDSATRLHTTSDRMGTMAANLRQTQGSAATAASMSAAAAEQASTGGQAVQQMVHDMHAIRDAAREIGEITGVINGIAFQTNILALNAAIEAARAGEQGKGFAVVATEVRHLAQRTSIAAQEINTLIAASVSKAEVGAARAESAGQQMAAIVSGVFEVRDLMGRMQEMASEQGRHIDQVEKDMQALEQMTQSNAILVEQSAVASSVLNDQAHELARTMQQFHSLT